MKVAVVCAVLALFAVASVESFSLKRLLNELRHEAAKRTESTGTTSGASQAKRHHNLAQRSNSVGASGGLSTASDSASDSAPITRLLQLLRDERQVSSGTSVSSGGDGTSASSSSAPAIKRLVNDLRALVEMERREDNSADSDDDTSSSGDSQDSSGDSQDSSDTTTAAQEKRRELGEEDALMRALRKLLN